MTITFVSRRNDHKLNNNPLIKQVLPQENLLQTLLTKTGKYGKRLTVGEENSWLVFGHDIETRFELPSVDGLLLSAFCYNEEEVIVIDNTSVSNHEIFTPEILKRCMFIAHNADFEARWGIANNFVPERYVCTLVNDRRLLAGQQGYKFDLISVINRRLGYEAIPQWMVKDIRETFKDCKYFTDEQILYNAADTIRLKLVYDKQLIEAAALNQLFSIKSINSRLILPIAQAECRGIGHNSTRWVQIAQEREKEAGLICEELTEIVTGQHGVILDQVNPEIKKEREKWENRLKRKQERQRKLTQGLKLLEEKKKTHLKSYQTQKDQLNKLMQEVIEQDQEEFGTINWGSQKQVLKIFELIGCPIPIAKDRKTRQMKSGVGKEHRANWFVNNADSPFLPLMTKFDKYKKIKHNVSSFGENWVKQYVRNGRAYTLFDQAGTDTGRWTSGSKGKDKTYANFSQIPSAQIYRECFTADEGRLLVTVDYKNQEGVIIISQSNDMEMNKITQESDQHSYLGTKCWRAVYKYRYEQTKDSKWLELANSYVMSQDTEEKKKERQKFKNSAGLFPVLYGCFPSKVASTAQITTKEAEIMIDVIKQHAPKAVKYLDSKSEEAIRNGYVLHNTRTNSRRWFQPVLNNLKYGFKLSESDKIAVEMAARNSPVQGTGSDIMKEAVIKIHLWSKLYKQDIQLMLTNYDEYLASVPIEKAEQYARVIREFMERSANNYLIPEVRMTTSCEINPYWSK